MIHKLTATIVATLLLTIGCSKTTSNDVEAELVVHFELFAEEAAARGVHIEVEELDIAGYVEQIESRGVLGQCKTYANGNKAVVVDQDYWSRSTEIQREYVVFHELGHCALGRDHDDTSDQFGNCLSIMQSGSDYCDGQYSYSNRDQLLDELFEN